MKKSILIFFAVVSLLVLSAISSSASDYTFSYSDKESVLLKAGVLDSSEISETGAAVTRAQFVSYAARLIKIPSVIDVENYYKDLPDSLMEADEINCFASNGYLTVGEDRLFNPDSIITGSEACKIMCDILGYSAYASARGGYPSGYLAVARSLDMDYVFSPRQITAEDVVNILFDGAFAPYCRESVIGDDYVKYAPEADFNIFSVHYDLYFDSGCVSSADGLWFGEGTYASKGEICLDGTVYKSGEIYNTGSFLGRKANIVYRSPVSTRKELFYIGMGDDDGVLEIDAKNIDKLDENNILYYYNDSGSRKSAKISGGVALNYNGELKTSDIRAAFDNIDNGYVYLIERDGTNGYDYAVIRDYKNVLVSSADSYDEVFYDKLTGDKYDFDEIENVKIYDYRYEPKDFSAIKDGMVLSVAKSGDEYAEILTGMSSVTVLVESWGESDDGFVVTAGSMDYFVHSTCLTDAKKLIRPGQKYTFVLNAFSEISDILPAENVFSAGYLIAYDDNASGMNDELRLKIFGQDGEMHIFDVEAPFTVDGTSVKKLSDVLPALCGAQGSFNSQIIRYKTNDEGLLREIDTLNHGENESDSDSLTESIIVDDSSNTSTVRAFNYAGTSLARIGMTNLANADTLFFMLPSPDDIKNGEYYDEQFRVVTESKVVADVGYNYSAYKTDTAHVYEDIIVLYDNGNVYYDDNINIMLVSDITRVLTGNNEDLVSINGFYGGKSVSMHVSPSFKGKLPDKGDTIGITRDARGQVTSVVMIYDFSRGGTPDTHENSLWKSPGRFNNGTNFSVKFECTFGYVTNKEGTAVAFAANPGEDYLTNYDETVDTSPYTVTVYDSALRTGNAYVGNISDIRDVHSAGFENASRILVHYRYVGIKDIIVYK